MALRSVVELAEAAAQRAEPGRALAAVAELRQRLDELEEYQVENARELGWSWSDIAQPLGVSRQAVHRKHARRLEDSSRASRGGRIVVRGDARRCVVQARREAAAFGHGSVGTDHLLLGVLAEEAVSRAVAYLGLTLERALFAVADLRGLPDRGGVGANRRAGRIPISQEARDVLEQSLHEALRLGNDAIGAEHLLLALLRDEGTAAGRVLAHVGVEPAAIQQTFSQ